MEWNDGYVGTNDVDVYILCIYIGAKVLPESTISTFISPAQHEPKSQSVHSSSSNLSTWFGGRNKASACGGCYTAY